MKELTIEQKAKAYDEAVKRVENIRTGKCETTFMFTKGLFEYIFPELAKSEDERIKKELLAVIDDLILPDEQKERFIAWLEKQGEFVEINPTEFDTRLQALIGKFGSLPKEELIGSLSFWMNVVQNDGTYNSAEKQGEQKSMKTCAKYYNKDSELKMPELSAFQNKLADILMQREYEGSTETEEDVARARLDYELAAIRISEELLPLAIMQKPVEWSEEDEREVAVLKAYINSRDWSDSHIDRALGIVDELVKKLKSLRPQSTWKPSEEMLEALYRAVPENVMEISEDEMLLDKLYQGLKYGRVLSKK